MSSILVPRQDAAMGPRLYRAIWRWHFYAGVIVVPFMITLALTGLIMIYGNSIETALGPKYAVSEHGERSSFVAQAEAARASMPGSTVKMFIKPSSASQASTVVVSSEKGDVAVAIDPNGAVVLRSIAKDKTWYAWASRIHGTLLIGDLGDRMIEVAAGLGIILVLTGLYLWWPRGVRGLLEALVPNLSAKGRHLWKQLHASVGFYVSIVLLFFLLSGLAWTGIWGGKMVQAWSTFPAEKWDNVPVSSETHASMNHGAAKDVPWTLEQTPLPASGSHAGSPGIPAGHQIDLDSVIAFAKSIGFDGQFRVNVPKGSDGVYTVSADTMDGDTTNPTGDRTVHIDQYTGKVLADVKFSDYSFAGKAMAVGIALHQGNLGVWNTAVNVVFCLLIVFLNASGIVLWWMRRPSGTLGSPLYLPGLNVPKTTVAIGLAVCILFPLTGAAVIIFAMVDFLLPKRMKEATGAHAS